MKLLQVIDYESFGDKWLDIAVKSSTCADMIWLRIKNVSDDVIKREAEKLRNALPEAVLLLSARADIAHETEFNGVQLGAGTETPDSVREKYPKLMTGYSAHSLDEIADVDADYFTLSPIFFTKKDYVVHPLGVVDVRPLRRKIFALGGISLGNVSKLRDMGYEGVAGISFYKELPELRRRISLW